MQITVHYNLHQQLRRAISDTRLIGIVLCIMGCIPPLIMFASGSMMTFPGEVLAVVNTAVLLGPGVWYIVAAAMMRRLNQYVPRVSIKIALAQLALILICLAVPFLDLIPIGRGSFIVPALMAVFQVPALIALIFVLRRADRVIKLLEPSGYAFEPLKVQAIGPPNDVGG